MAKNGRHLEDVSRQKNPGDTPFKFLFDKSCADYKYYEYQLAQEEKALSLQSKEPQKSRNGGVGIPESRLNSGSQRILNSQAHNYQTPASALYEATDGSGVASDRNGESGSTTSADPVAMMEFYMKKAAREEKRRLPRQSKDEMPPPPSLHG